MFRKEGLVGVSALRKENLLLFRLKGGRADGVLARI